MTFLRRRRLGILLIAISVVFLIAAVTSLFYYYRTQEEYYPLPPNEDIVPVDWSKKNRAWQEEQERRFHQKVFPYKWLALPLTISGIAFFGLGWLFYHEKTL